MNISSLVLHQKEETPFSLSEHRSWSSLSSQYSGRDDSSMDNKSMTGSSISRSSHSPPSSPRGYRREVKLPPISALINEVHQDRPGTQHSSQAWTTDRTRSSVGYPAQRPAESLPSFSMTPPLPSEPREHRSALTACVQSPAWTPRGQEIASRVKYSHGMDSFSVVSRLPPSPVASLVSRRSTEYLNHSVQPPNHYSHQASGMHFQRPLPSLDTLSLPGSVNCSPVEQAASWQYHQHHISPHSSAAFASQHAEKYICQQCNKAFSRPSSLKIHSHSHTGEKPFPCPHTGCGKAFSVRSNMKRHERGCHPI